jgi:hypothetical protein
MLDNFRRPVSWRLLIVGVLGAGLVVSLYCMVYTRLAGRPETFAESFAWAVANICPWLVAIEVGKRARGLAEAVAVLTGAAAASVVLGYLLAASNDSLPFELLRRAPALAAAAVAVALLRSGIGRTRNAPAEMPLQPGQIDWIRAAGNYVELRTGRRTIVHRGSISAAERELARFGFVRIHRSMLVRRDRIARVRRQDVVLHDGTHLPIGKRYRAALAA